MDDFEEKHGAPPTELYTTKEIEDSWLIPEVGALADGDTIYGMRVHMGAAEVSVG